jgi:hypothetical protein
VSTLRSGTREIDFRRRVRRMAGRVTIEQIALAGALGSSMSTNLTTFSSHGGKLIFYAVLRNACWGKTFLEESRRKILQIATPRLPFVICPG